MKCRQTTSEKMYGCFSHSGADKLHCFPTLSFRLQAKVELTLQPKDYIDVIKTKDAHTRIYALRLKPHHALTDDEQRQWVFGVYFLRKYYTLFDHKRKEVAFALAAPMPAT